MKTFDVRIATRKRPGQTGPPASTDPGTSGTEVHFRVAADSWVDAWHQALSALGDPTIPEDASCTVGPARVEVECPSQTRRFLIEPLAERDPRVRPGQPMLVGEGGELVPVHLEGPLARERSTRFSTVRGAPLAPSAISFRKLGPVSKRHTEPTPTTTPELARDQKLRLPESRRASPEAIDARADWRDDAADPLARVLSGLERQRLLARPVRINPRTGLPTPLEVGVAAAQPVSAPPPLAPRTSPTGTRVDSRGPGPASDRRVRVDLPDLSRSSSREPTSPAVPRLRPAPDRAPAQPDPILEGARGGASLPSELDSEATSLPQQYRPVLNELVPPSGDALLDWAAELAWQQIPCALSLCLGGVEPLVVVAARGLRGRETLGGRLRRDGAPDKLWRMSHRVRYAEGAPVVIEHPDGGRIELRVDSALCMPISGGDEPLSLLLFNSPRPTGFTDGEARALAYLARTVAEHR